MARPEMHAYTCEAYVAQLATLLSLLNLGDTSLYGVFAVDDDNRMHGLELPLSTEFVRRVNEVVDKLLTLT